MLTADDLLVSLIQTHDPSTYRLLASMRTDDEVHRLTSVYGGTLQEPVPPGNTRLSAEVTRVLRAARREAKGQSAVQIEPVHLLLGLFGRMGQNWAHLLAAHGVTYDTVLAALRGSEGRPNAQGGPSQGRHN